MAQNSDNFNTNSLEMSGNIEHLLNVGCQAVGAKKGVLLHFTEDHTAIIAHSEHAELLATDVLPPIDLSSHSMPSGIVSSWVNKHFNSQTYILGQRHVVDGHNIAMLYFAPIDKLANRSSALLVLDRWLECLFCRDDAHYSPHNHRRLYEKLQSVAKIGTWEIDVINQTLTWSTQTKRIHDVPSDYEPKLDTAIEFYKEGTDREQIQWLVSHAMETGDPWHATLRLVTAKSNEVWVETHGMVEMLEGRCIRIFGTFQNVDRAVRLRLEVESRRQDAVTALKERDLLLSRISHELRTPLNGIIGMLQAIKVEEREHIRDRKTDFALKSAEQLHQLVNDVLDYTELASGKLSLANEPFAIRTLFSTITDDFEGLCHNKGIEFNVEYAVPEQCTIKSDVSRIGQMVTQLLSNAVKYTSSGAIILTLTLRENDESAGCSNLLISVEDSGEGMNDVTRENLFKPLIHGDKLASSKLSGTGLGLSIVKQIVDKMEGEIRFESCLNQGSRFDISLPVEVVSDNECILSEPLLATPLSILVVDDNEINRMVLTSMLDSFNYVADEAEDGEIALEKARKKPYDIIFMDCAMPVLDGVAATKIIIEENLLSGCGQVVAVTANTAEDDKKACKGAGMSDFLCKPVAKKAVASALKRVLIQKSTLE